MNGSPRIQRPQRKSTGEILKVWGPLLLLVAIGFAIAIAKLEPSPPRSFAIAAGSPGGAYHVFAERYREILAGQGFELEIVETAGALENHRLLLAGEVSLALLQGGARTEEPSAASGQGRIESLASLFFEPVWVFHRAELPMELLSDLVGRRIAIGPVGSGTRSLAIQLLADNDLDPTNSELLPLTSTEAANALEDASVNAAIFVTAADSEVIRQLIERDDITLLSMRRTLAYRKAHPFLSRVVLGEGVLDIDDNLPREDVNLVATAASLGAVADLHHALVPLLLRAMKEVHGGVGLLDAPQTFPAVDFVEHPLNAAAEHYLINGPSFLERWVGYRAATSIDRLKILLLPLITLLIPVFKTAPPIYRWRIRSKIYRWYEDLHWADEILHEQPTREEITFHLEALRKIQREVSRVSVPLSYMDEYYSLRVHIQLIVDKLHEIEARLDSSSPARSEGGPDA